MALEVEEATLGEVVVVHSSLAVSGSVNVWASASRIFSLTRTPSGHSSERSLELESVKNCIDAAGICLLDSNHLNRYSVSFSHLDSNSCFDYWPEHLLSLGYQALSCVFASSHRKTETNHNILPHR